MRITERKSFYLLMNGFISFALIFYSSEILAASGITFHGKILKPDNSPVSSANTQFKIQIRSPGSENCLLWEETQNYDMSTGNGVFTLTIADSNASGYFRTDAYSWGLDRVFSNRLNFSALANCTVGTTYNPSTADGRLLQVAFREQPTDPWENMTSTKINYVPLSLNSVQLAGYQATEFLKIDPASTQTPLTTGQVTTLLDLVTGNYLKAADATTGDLGGTYGATIVDGIRGVGVDATLPTLNQVLKFNGTVWAPAADDSGTAPGDASYAAKGVVQLDTNLATSGLNIAAGVLSMPNVITAGGPTGNAQTIPVITYDAKGRLTTVTTATVDDNTKLPLVGGTMTGAIDMGNQNITNANSVSATSLGARSLRIFDADNSNYVDIQTPTAVTTNYMLTLPADDGTTGQVLSTDGNGVLSWIANGSGGSGDILNGGNSTGAAITIGTNDNFNLNFETANITGMTLDNLGYVGIGTTTPSTKLDVNGSANVSGAISIGSASGGGNPNPMLSWRSAAGTIGELGRVPGTDQGFLKLYQFGVASPRVYIDAGWNPNYVYSSFGVGTETPASKLSINGGASIGSSYAGTNAAPANGMIVQGNVGIGTSSPTTRLEVSGTSWEPMILNSTSSANTALSIKNSTSAASWSLVTGGSFGAFGSGSFVVYDNTTRLLIQPTTGFVGVGYFDSLTQPTSRLDINGAVTMREMAAPALSSADQGRIYFDSTANKFKVSENGGAYVDLVGAGGGGTPAGANTQIQFNNAGAFGASNNFIWDNSNGRLGVGANLQPPATSIQTSMYSGTDYLATSLVPQGMRAVNINNLSGNNDFMNLSFALDPNSSGVYASGAMNLIRPTAGSTQGDFGFQLSNSSGNITEVMRMTGSGFVGIGTSNPNAPLHLYDTGTYPLLKLEAGSSNVVIQDFQVGSSFGTGSYRIQVNAGATGMLEYAYGSGLTKMFTIDGPNNRTFFANGNVGIGTSSPSSLLDILGAVTVRGVVPQSVSPIGQGRIYYDSTANKFKVSENGNSYVDLLATSGANQFTSLTDVPNSYSGAANQYVRVNGAGNGLVFSPVMVQSVSGQPAPSGMDISDLASVDILSPLSGECLTYNGSLWVNSDCTMTPAGNNNEIQFNSAGILSSSPNFLWNNSTNKLIVTGDIEYSGNLTNTSDMRAKENIEEVGSSEDILNKILEINAYRYNYKKDPEKRKHIGVLAQEVQDKFPELVVEKNDDLKTKSVDYQAFVPLLIESIKQQQKLIELQQQQINQLKKQIEQVQYGK